MNSITYWQNCVREEHDFKKKHTNKMNKTKENYKYNHYNNYHFLAIKWTNKFLVSQKFTEK